MVNANSTNHEREIIQRRLQDLVAEEYRDRLLFSSQLEENLTPEELVHDFLRTNVMRQIYEQAFRYLLANWSKMEKERIVLTWAGLLYENLAYYLTSRTNSSSQVILSPERTFDFFRVIYPDARVIEDEMGVKTLGGISVPDGLTIEVRTDQKLRVTRMWEYTSVQEGYTLKDKITGFEMTRDNYPELFAHASHNFLVLDGFIPDPETDRNPRVNFHYMPLSSLDFGCFVHRTYKKFSVNGDATLKDLVKRFRYQNENDLKTRFLVSSGRYFDSMPLLSPPKGRMITHESLT